MNKKIAIALALALISTSAFASKKKAPDVYSATEDSPSEEVIGSAPGYTGESIDVKPALPAPKRRVTPPSSVEEKTAEFDAVPNSQAEPLIRRLRLVETLIAKYGRAYDYKTLTVTELQTILGRLDTQATQTIEVRRRAITRADLKKTVDAPTPAESTDSIGSEAPELPAPFEGGGNGAETVAPNQNP